MRVCVGTAKTSSPTENSARHTFQDRAYPYGRNARKRTKKSGIIYCLVTSHPSMGLGTARKGEIGLPGRGPGIEGLEALETRFGAGLGRFGRFSRFGRFPGPGNPQFPLTPGVPKNT